ncbi:MAG TPA: Uma2 family endonuclease [Candidatus Baltobacteraceae bacterium]|jgi:Uma2 family endonuclease
MARTALLTYADLERFPEDHVRRELIEGELLVSPSAVPAHQFVVGEIFVRLHEYAARHGAVAFCAEVDVVFGDRDVTAPDLTYIGSERREIIGEKAILGAPSLLVEVISPSSASADRVRKRALYARYGVCEYWIVDIARKTIERCARPVGESYEEVQAFNGGSMPSATLEGLSLDLDAVFAWPPK